jgi:release factor glutamine methyltransferase
MENQDIAWLLKEKYQGVESAAFHADCAQLAAGVPLGYLIGHVPFLDCTIYLDSHPLIPRPETEYWVELAINAIIQNLRGRTPQILDLCAGSGAIGVAVAKTIPHAHVTLAEIDPAHLPTIKRNVDLNVPTHGVIEIIESDLFSALHLDTAISSFDDFHKQDHGFDYILTNPPYIDAAAGTIDANVAAHEPHLALFGGEAGMEVITRIIQASRAYLQPTGQLWIEHEPAQKDAVLNLGVHYGFTVVTHPDQYGVARFSVLSVAQ